MTSRDIMKRLIVVAIGLGPAFSAAGAAQQRSSPRPRQERQAERGGYCPTKGERGSFCPRVGARARGERGCTPLMRAAEGGRLKEVRALLTKGADVNAKLSHGHTALMLAAGEGHLEIVRALLAAGADPNAAGATFHGGPFTAWMFAMNRCHKNWPEMMDAMLDAGVEINPGNGIHLSPLWYAIGEGEPVIVGELLKRGADVNLRDPQTGETPLMFAVRYSSPDVVRALIDAGADINAKNNEGRTALAIIEDYGENIWREEVILLLKESGAQK